MSDPGQSDQETAFSACRDYPQIVFQFRMTRPPSNPNRTDIALPSNAEKNNTFPYKSLSWLQVDQPPIAFIVTHAPMKAAAPDMLNPTSVVYIILSIIPVHIGHSIALSGFSAHSLLYFSLAFQV